MTTLIFVLLGIMPILVIIAGLKDLTSMTIPNWISGLLVVTFFPVGLATGLPLNEILIHVGVAVLVLLVGMAMFALRWVGGGDAKLLASTCLWLGFAGLAPFLLYTALVGGVFGLLLIAARTYIRPWISNATSWVVALLEPKGDIPYGVAIAIGALLAYPTSPLVLAAMART